MHAPLASVEYSIGAYTTIAVVLRKILLDAYFKLMGLIVMCTLLEHLRFFCDARHNSRRRDPFDTIMVDVSEDPRKPCAFAEKKIRMEAHFFVETTI